MESNPVVFILDSNANSREVLKTYLEEFGYGEDIRQYEDYEKGIDEIKNQGNSSIVFVDMGDSVDKYNEAVKKIKLYTSKIVITSVNYSTDLIIKAMRLGAKDFLPKPILKEDLKRIMLLISNLEPENETSASKIITIYSNKGGIGKTTVACNLAAELAKVSHDKVALIDLNLQLGDISTFFNINPSFDVSYIIKNLLNKKENTILNAFEKFGDTGLYILSDPNYIEQSESISPYQIGELFSTLKSIFPYIIVDMSSAIDPNSLKILDCSDMILFTNIINIPAIRNCQRCLNLFKSRRYPDNKVKVIINRYMENDEIKIEDIENTIGEKIYWKIPNNYFSIMDAINKGVPVSEISSNSNIANSFRDLATKIADEIVQQALEKYKG